jgi:serine phosphatase RsbU (regulator of sigma subunit)
VPLGAIEEGSYQTSTLALPPGSRLVLFSDGVVEQRSARGEAFGIRRLIDLVGVGSEPHELVDRIVTAVGDHAGAGVPADDLTVAAIALRPGS